MAYVAEYQRPYEGGYVDLPDESTPEMAAFINARDDALLKIEQFLANLDLSGLGNDYALLSEAGYSLGLDIDSNYIMTISLKNKAGEILDSKNIDFPIESVVVNATYENGKIILALQNGNTLPIDISDMVRGLVPSARKIAGIDLADDITKEELKQALELGEGGEIPTKVSQLENDAGYITQDDITEAGSVSAGEIKPWLYDTSGEESIVGVYGGKPLYQKIFVFNDVYGRVDADISLDNVERAFLTEAIATNKEGNKLPLPYIHPDSISWAITIFINNDYTKLGFRVGDAFSQDSPLTNIIVTIRYTKTTDAEGSGNDLKPYGIYDAKLDDIKKDIEELQKPDITETTETTMPNSNDGRFLFKKIKGVCEQGENPSPTSPQEVKNSVVSGIKTHNNSGNNSSVTLSNPIDLYAIGDVQDVIESGKVNRRLYEITSNSCNFDDTNLLGSIELPDNIAVKTDWNIAYKNVISNMFSTVMSRNSIVNEKNQSAIAISTTDSGRCIILFKIVGIEQTAEAYNTFLANTPLETVIERATYITENLPLTDQIALNSLATYDGTTHLEFDSEINPTFEGKYGTSKVGGMTLESLLTARNNDLRLSSLEASVVNNI